MNNEQLLDALKQGPEGDAGEKQQEQQRKYVIFSLGEEKLAFPAAEVREISADSKLFYVPFLPPYIRGFANRHGLPYTVFDLQLLFKNEQLDDGVLLVLNVPGDQIAILISDIEEMISVPLSQVTQIHSSEELMRFFLESVHHKGAEVMVVHTACLLEQLERDIER